MNVEMPDGTVIEGVPEGVTKSQLMARYKKFPIPDVDNGTNIPARLGRIGISAIAAPADLVYAAGTGAYNLERGLQQASGQPNIAPEINIPSPGDMARAAYDRLTNNAGKSQGAAKIADTAAEYLIGGAGLGKAIPGMASKTSNDLIADAATGAATEYTKQEVSDNPVAQMMAGIISALAARKGTDIVADIAEKPSLQLRAQNKVLQRLSESGMTPYSLNADRAIVDIGGKNVERLGEAVANIPGKGADIAEKFVANRVANAGKNIKTAISNYISTGGSLDETAEDIMKAGRERAAPKYEAAYNIDIIPDKELKSLMQRPSMVQAAKNAARIAADEGQDLATLGTKTRFYDYIKRGLDDVLEGYRDKTTGRLVLDTQGRAVEGLRKEYVDMLKKRNPLLKEALAESATYFESKNALQSGKDFLDKTQFELKKSFNSLNATDKELFKLGVANKLRDMVDSANIGTDISRRIFGKQEYQDSLRTILEPKEYGAFKKAIEQQAEEHKLNQRLLGNSRTMLRKEEIDDLMRDPTELLNIAGSPAKFGITKATQYIINTYNGLNKEVAGEIAKILFESDPIKRKDIILKLQRRAAGGFKPALRGYTLWNNISKNIARSATLQSMNQGE